MLPSTLSTIWLMNLQSLEVATSNGLGGDELTRKYSNCHLTWVNVTQDVDHMHLQRLKLLRLKVEEEMLTRQYRFCPVTLTLGSRSHAMLDSTLYIMWSMQIQKNEVATSNDWEDATCIWPFSLTQNIAQWPLHLVTYAAANFEEFKRRWIYKKIQCLTIWPWPFDKGYIKYWQVSSTIRDIYRYQFWSCYV